MTKKFETISLRKQYEPIVDIGLPELIVIDKKYGKKNELLYVAVPADLKRPHRCPHCGFNNIVVKKTVTRQIRDLESNGYKTAILLYVYYYRCNKCGSVLSPDYDCISGNLTKRLKERIQFDSFGMEFADVAKLYGVSAMTVGNLFRERASHYWSTYQLEMPKVLGIDEVHLKKHYYGVFVNVNKVKGDIIELSPGRSKEDIKKVLKSMSHPENLKMVTIDMWSPYRDAVKELFPKVAVVIDRFHVIKELQKGLERIRKKISKEIQEQRKTERNKHERVALQQKRVSLKDNRFTLLTSMENLTPGQVKKRDALLHDYPQFTEPYLIKEAFRNIYETAQSSKDALAKYEQWKEASERYPEFDDFKKTIENWKTEIFAYFDFTGDRTNAQTESLNAVIKERERAGRGLSYDVMRAKMIFRRETQKPIQYFPFDYFKV